MNKILEVRDLKKNFQTVNGEINAINNISFDLYDKEFLCIVGSSGCGKSTLLNILAGLDNKTSGIIKYKEDLKIGYMLQEDALFPWLNILDNAMIGLKITKTDTKENEKFVKSLLIKYGLKDFIYKYPKELSGGMRQRVL
ncbi:ATP-binding cassette domain-containing protein [bacterium]|nr:ATP-binding cassette domain-containing protein [bacterium]